MKINMKVIMETIMMTRTRDFVSEFRERMRLVDEPKYESPKPRYDEPLATPLVLFNIFKRAVPFSANPLNKIVAINLLLEDAEKMKARLDHTEDERRGFYGASAEGVFFFYDIVPASATLLEQSPFYNEGSPVL